MKKLFIISLTILLLSGCGTVAEITDPLGKVYTYKGPKDVDMSIKQGDIEIKYSGKTSPWWHSMLPFIFKSVPDVTVVK